MLKRSLDLLYQAIRRRIAKPWIKEHDNAQRMLLNLLTPEITEASFKNGNIKLDFRGQFGQIIVEFFARLLNGDMTDDGSHSWAPNYVEFQAFCKAIPEGITVTAVRNSGKTPNELKQLYENALEKLVSLHETVLRINNISREEHGKACFCALCEARAVLKNKIKDKE